MNHINWINTFETIIQLISQMNLSIKLVCLDGWNGNHNELSMGSLHTDGPKTTGQLNGYTHNLLCTNNISTQKHTKHLSYYFHYHLHVKRASGKRQRSTRRLHSESFWVDMSCCNIELRQQPKLESSSLSCRRLEQCRKLHLLHPSLSSYLYFF